MNKCIIGLVFWLCWVSISAQEISVDTIHYAGAIENRVNFVILGDGYVEAQKDDFLEDAQTASDDLLDELPFENYKNYANVFSIFVPSNVPGAAINPNQIIDNQFGSTFNYAGIERLLVPTKPERVVEVLTEYFPQFDQVVMLVNTGRYGGSGGWIATSSTHESAGEIVRHEIGHSLGKLADEYWAGSQYAKETHNMSRESVRSENRWRNWVGDFGVGIIPYPANPSWYKPHDFCKMEALDNRFCRVCTESLVRVFQDSVDPIDHFSPVEQVLNSDPVTFEIDPVLPSPNTLTIDWTLDDELIGRNVASVELDAETLSSSQELRVSVMDTTKYERKQTVFISTVVWTIGSAVTAEADLSEEVKEQDRVLSVQASQEPSFSVQVFPNPTTDYVSVSHDAANLKVMQMELINKQGQVLDRLESSKTSNANTTDTIDLRAYPAGIYFLRIQSETFEHQFKLIKQ